MAIIIAGSGSDLPEQIVTNDEIESATRDFDRERAGSSLHDWVMKRNGVRQRHRVAPDEATSDMATRAASRALADAGLAASEVQLIVLSTVTPDYRVPSTASQVQSNLGCGCKFLQLDDACSGFVDALIVAKALMDLLQLDHALVVGADATSRIIDPDAFMLQTIFGDGAGAAVLRRLEDESYGMLAYYAEADGRVGDWTFIQAGGSRQPASHATVEAGHHHLRLDHRNIFSTAIEKMADSSIAVARRAGVTLDQVRWFVPHQAGLNIIEETARKLGQPLEKFWINVERTGNTSAATIGIAIDEMCQQKQLADGDLVLLTAAGAGMAWSALCMRWYGPNLARA